MLGEVLSKLLDTLTVARVTLDLLALFATTQTQQPTESERPNMQDTHNTNDT